VHFKSIISMNGLFQLYHKLIPAYIEGGTRSLLRDPRRKREPEYKKLLKDLFRKLQWQERISCKSNGVWELMLPHPKGWAIQDSWWGWWETGIGAYRLILGYRNKGHLIAKTTLYVPVRIAEPNGLSFDGFTEPIGITEFFGGNLIGLGTTSLNRF